MEPEARGCDKGLAGVLVSSGDGIASSDLHHIILQCRRLAEQRLADIYASHVGENETKFPDM
jgi:hypothetical protein